MTNNYTSARWLDFWGWEASRQGNAGGWGRKKEKVMSLAISTPRGDLDGCHHRVRWLPQWTSWSGPQDAIEAKFHSGSFHTRIVDSGIYSSSAANSGQLWTPLVCDVKDYAYRQHETSTGERLWYFMRLGGRTYLSSYAKIDPWPLCKMTACTASWSPFWQLLILMWGCVFQEVHFCKTGNHGFKFPLFLS